MEEWECVVFSSVVFKAKFEGASVEGTYQEMFSFLLGGALVLFFFLFINICCLLY